MPPTLRFSRLSCFIAIPALVAARSQGQIQPQPALHQSSMILSELQAMASEPENHPHTNHVKHHQRQVVQAVAAIDQFTKATSRRGARIDDGDRLREFGGEECGEPAELLLSTGTTLINDGQGSITFIIAGNKGEQQFTFASGTSLLNIARAINIFTTDIGVKAAQSVVTPERVILNSEKSGEDQFVSVQQLFVTLPLVLSGPDDNVGSFEEIDFGEGIRGDLNCDGRVNVRDLLTLIRLWGPCQQCPADLNGNGTVDVEDLLELLSFWNRGKPTRPPRGGRR